jgi:hypothetical protein
MQLSAGIPGGRQWQELNVHPIAHDQDGQTRRADHRASPQPGPKTVIQLGFIPIHAMHPNSRPWQMQLSFVTHKHHADPELALLIVLPAVELRPALSSGESPNTAHATLC